VVGVVVVVVELPAPSDGLPPPSDAPDDAGFSPLVPVELAAGPVPSVAVASVPLAVELALERLASRASFLAQPDPLNTMAGAERARFIGPPHRSHAAGPAAEMPWITSTTWPHDSQT
jgi:hypothetical protein